MIRYTLTCEKDHQFESWFQNAEAYDKLRKAGMVVCTSCGSADVAKSLMAPSVPKKGGIVAPRAKNPIEKIREEVEKNSDYVGLSFAQEARDMHDGLIPERAIYGEANAQEARKLVEDGVPVLPLPFVPKKKAN